MNYIKVNIPLFFGTACGVACGLVLFLCKIPSMNFTRLEFLLNTIITSSTTVSGFILAAIAIVVSSPSSEIMKEIKKNHLQYELQWWYTEALILGAIVILYFAILGIIIDGTNEVSCFLLSLSTGILGTYISSVFFTCRYLLKIVGFILDDGQCANHNTSVPKGGFK